MKTTTKQRRPTAKQVSKARLGVPIDEFRNKSPKVKLSPRERLTLLDGLETLFQGAYTHLPLKRARYGFDPVQRVRILRMQATGLSPEDFDAEVDDIFNRLRDFHTVYWRPGYEGMVAALPCMVELYYDKGQPHYMVSKVGEWVRKPGFVPGVEVETWNGVPIDRAVQRYSDREVGGRPDSLRAWATQSLTLRSLQYGPPPDEHWVIVGYRAVTATGTPTGAPMEIKVPWRIVDPSDIAPLLAGGPVGRRARLLRHARAVDPAAAVIRQVKMLLFAPGALTGRQADTPRQGPAPRARRAPKADVIPTRMTETLKVMSIDAPGGPVGYLRIWGFDAEPEPFIAELQRLIPLLPDRGLIIDVRGNPGGFIWAAELALQLFTPKPIKPTRFSVLATPFTREMANLSSLRDELAPWRSSLAAAVRNGELYSQPIPITDPAACNAIGQQYGGPVVLVADSTTYSSGDLFSAGFVDNDIGPFVCVGEATGAGGANVWDYADLRSALKGSPIELPLLPDGIGLSFAFRRATRSRPSEGLPIEDVGIAGMPYAMTRDDLLAGNRDLIAHCIVLLQRQPLTRMQVRLDRAARTVTATTDGLTRLDWLVDGHPGSSAVVGRTARTAFSFPPGTSAVELVGFAGQAVRQRRRIAVST